MSTHQDGPDMTYPAAADLSSTGQYRFMKLNSSEQAAIAATQGEWVIGVLQNDPAAAGRPALVRKYGTTKIEAGATFATGEALTTDSAGRAIQSIHPTDFVIGRAVDDGVVGEISEILITNEGAENANPLGWFEDFASHDTADEYASIALVGTVASGTADAANLCYTPGGNVFNWEPWGTQTLLNPAAHASGMNIAFDQTANDGVEFNAGYLGATGGHAVVGKTPAFFARLQFSIADVSGTDDFQFGFRDMGIARPNFDDYIDAVTLGCDAADGTVSIETIVNNAGTTTTDTNDTILDGVTYQFKILVSAAGVVTYQHDIASAGTLAAPTAVAALTLADGLPLIPFFRHLQGTDLTGAFVIEEFEYGLQ